MTITLNRDFLLRHLFALSVFLLLAGWFGYDALVRYPSTSARDLYVSIEKIDVKDQKEVERLKAMKDDEFESFKAQKVATQRLLALATLAAGFAVGLHLLLVARVRFAFDDDGFTCGDVRRKYDEITSLDASKWDGKGILVLSGADWRIKLDAWHHRGVKDFYEKVRNRG